MTFAKELPEKLAGKLIGFIGIVLVLMAGSIGGLYLRVFVTATQSNVKEDIAIIRKEFKDDIKEIKREYEDKLKDQRNNVDQSARSQELLILAKLEFIRATSESNRDHLQKLDEEVRNLSSEVSSLVAVLKQTFQKGRDDQIAR